MSSHRRRILNRFAAGCAIAAGVSLSPVALVPDSMLAVAMRWSPITAVALLTIAAVLARVASWLPASSSPPAAVARREVLALPAAPHRQHRNERPVLAVRAGQPRNALPGGVRHARVALPAAPERVS